MGAVIVAGGLGLRAGGELPKQEQLLAGKPVFQWSLEAFIKHPDIHHIALVIPAARRTSYQHIQDAKVQIVAGGLTRSASVKAGLDALDLGPDEIVLIHDAARPGLDGEMIDRLVQAMQSAAAAAPALPISDALKRQTELGLESVSRNDLHRIQTPQAFRYRDILTALQDQAPDFVDDLAAIEAKGRNVILVEGRLELDKITYSGDLDRMTRLLGIASPPRIGQGFDVHAFEPGDHVVLCGHRIEHNAQLKGHSDADVGWHALTDAILGALAAGDIGDHFPPSDPQWQDVESGVFLSHALKLADARGYVLDSCDITLICEAPKVKPHREAMRLRTAEICSLPIDAVSIKATTTEQLGFTGRREGIAAQAIAVLSAQKNTA
ncbi:MAG: bifunctional 2-C-methyl-D-erythritol 4-phosphate cytidylyltransferase/2-C-methyl-D-erythritol 2,4-cyclodiphosphate synthase [Henriciella sp.]